MGFCPFAEQKILPESSKQPSIKPRAVILHSAAGRGSLYKFFLNSSNLESHFWVSETGVIEQYISTNVRADANLNANSFAISIETESSVTATERWSPAQAAAIVKLVTWICDTHGIPKKQIESATGSGIGWHIMFGSPGPWTPVAKSCPGPARIKQARDEIIPQVANAVVKPPQDTGELTVAQIDEILKRFDSQDKILKTLADDYLTKGKGVRQTIAEVDKRTDDLLAGKRTVKCTCDCNCSK